MLDLYTMFTVHCGRIDDAPAAEGANGKTKTFAGMGYKITVGKSHQVLAYWSF
jgi:hypothetical protein